MSTTSHSFSISEISSRGKPRPRNVFNEFDSFGVMLGLERLPSERNESYKARLLDVYTRRAGSNYIGLLNGLTRELGLEWYRPVTATLNAGLNPTWVPALEFQEGFLRIYKNYNTKELELEIKLGEAGRPEYFLGALVDFVNLNSSIYTFTLLDNKWAFSRSDSIINQSTSKLVLSAPLQDSHSTVLDHKNIQKETVVFTDRSTFKRERPDLVSLVQDGDFFIDYESGVVRSFRIADGGSEIRYRYNLPSIDLLATPVILRSTQSEEFRSLMFSQVIGVDGSVSAGVPSEMGAEIINELLSVVPTYWGR